MVFVFSGVSRSEEVRVKNAEEFHRRMEAAHPGDVIELASGQWRDVELIADATGTSTSPITIRAEEPGKVVISGNSRIRIAGSHVVVTGLRIHGAWHETALVEFRRDSKKASSDCRLTDCEIVDCNSPDGKADFKYLSIYGRNNAVDHCRLEGKENGGTTLVVWLDEQEAGEHTIRDNHFGPRPYLGRNGGETIRIGDSKTARLSGKCLVEGNLFEECDGESEIISNKSCDNLYRHNVFLRCSGTLTLRHGHRCLIAQNLFLGEKARGSGGVRIIGSDHTIVNNYFERLEGDDYRSALCVMNGIPDSPANGYQVVERALIAHNTFFDCKRTILVGADNDEKTQVSPKDCQFANNAIISRRGPMIDVRMGAHEIRWFGNLCFGEGDLGIDSRRGIRKLSDPLLKKGKKRWVLFATSPLVDAGKSLDSLPSIDFSGRTRDGSPDVGCDEWPVDDEFGPTFDASVGPRWSPIVLNP